MSHSPLLMFTIRTGLVNYWFVLLIKKITMCARIMRRCKLVKVRYMRFINPGEGAWQAYDLGGVHTMVHGGVGEICPFKLSY